jgi:hypothetical protein
MNSSACCSLAAYYAMPDQVEPGLLALDAAFSNLHSPCKVIRFWRVERPPLHRFVWPFVATEVAFECSDVNV